MEEIPQQPIHMHGAEKMALNDQGLPEQYPFQHGWEITPRQVQAMLDSEDAPLLIDCRTPEEFQIARIDGARLVPLTQGGDGLDELKPYIDKKIMVYCHHGKRSLMMTQILRGRGFNDAVSMAGGIDLWAIDIDPAMRRY